MPVIHIRDETREKIDKITKYIEDETLSSMNLKIKVTIADTVDSLCDKFIEEEGVDV